MFYMIPQECILSEIFFMIVEFTFPIVCEKSILEMSISRILVTFAHLVKVGKPCTELIFTENLSLLGSCEEIRHTLIITVRQSRQSGVA